MAEKRADSEGQTAPVHLITQAGYLADLYKGSTFANEMQSSLRRAEEAGSSELMAGWFVPASLTASSTLSPVLGAGPERRQTVN